MTPSFFAPSASIARCEAKLKLSVRRPTTWQPSASNACVEQQQLACGVDVAALPASRVPGVADLDAVESAHDVVIARAADDRVRRELAYRPRQHVAGALARERGVDVGARIRRVRVPT